MASPRQIEANRLNALKSTGPKTQAGKARVSCNAIKHGLCAAPLRLIRDEAKSSFQAFYTSLRDDRQPVGLAEEDCVLKMAQAAWAVKESHRLETQTYIDQRYDEAGNDRGIYFAFKNPAKDNPHSRIWRYRSMWQNRFFKAWNLLRRYQAERKNPKLALKKALKHPYFQTKPMDLTPNPFQRLLSSIKNTFKTFKARLLPWQKRH